MLRCVPQGAERFHYIRLGLPLFRFQFVTEILVNSRRTCAVKQDEDFQLLLHATSSVIVIPSEVEESWN
jgi:hypothetical protein